MAVLFPPPDAVTLGAVPQPDDPTTTTEQAQPESDSELEERVKEMKLTDDADSIPVLPSTHEKADMLMAYSTVPGTVTHA